MDDDIQQQSQAYNIPGEQEIPVQFLLCISKIIDKGRCDTGYDIEIDPFKSDQFRNQFIDTEPEQDQFNRDTDNMQQGQLCRIETVDEFSALFRRKKNRDQH